MANKLFQNNWQYFTNNLHKNQNSFGIYIQCQINEHSVCYTAKNVQVATRLLTSCCYQQADIRMRSHGLRHAAC